jgi:predicted amidophosphoribosyltransferase
VAGSVESVAKTMSSNTLVPCPDCGHLVSQLAEACPSCARPLRKPAPREGLFLRTMNQAVSAAFWIPVSVLLLLLGTGVVAYLFGYFNPPR